MVCKCEHECEHKHLTHSTSETSKTTHDLEVNLDLGVNAAPADRAASDFGSQLPYVITVKCVLFAFVPLKLDVTITAALCRKKPQIGKMKK